MYCISLDLHKPTLLSFSSLLLSLHYFCGYYMMDSWKYLAQQRGVFISEELDFPYDGNGNGSCNKNNNILIGNETKPMYSFENYPPFVSNARAFDRLDSMEMCFSDDIRKSSYSNEPSGDVFSTGTGTDSCGNVVVSPFCDGNVAVSSGVMSQSAKGARFSSTSLYPKTSICQVYGCDKDLSSYKGYYKRHKVCDVHTKTAKVIVEGVEQRFCQQCSRFHRLAEFDDGKRSCRRRLAAHNKRRRKPQHASESSGSRIIGFSSSLALPDMFPNSDIDSARKGTGNIANGMKDGTLDLESLSSIQRTTSALSLLSAQSLNIPTQLLEPAITSPLINKSGSHTPGMYLAGANHAKPTLINHYDDTNSTVYLKFQDDSVSVGPYLRNNHYDNNTNYHNNPLGRGVVLDLLQLSSHLQRIEHQKHSTESGA